MDHASHYTKPLSPNRKHKNNNSTPFASLENKSDSPRQTEEQLLFKTSINSNNNENNRPFITTASSQSPSSIVLEKKQQPKSIPSPHPPLTIVHDENVSPTRTGIAKKRDLFIPQTYKATKHRVERTCLRPTTGGKTVAAMKYLHNDKRHHHQASNNSTIATLGNSNHHSNGSNSDNDNDILNRRLSAEQLKLLSRRIDPSAPLQSPHSSPIKPALPNSFNTIRASLSPSRRRQQQQQQHQTSPQLQYNYANNTSTASGKNGTSSNNNNNNNSSSTGDNSTNQSSSFSSSLYQTCMAIWANSPPSLGDLRHENIKYLSELLKIRLNQAKARALASMGSQDVTANNVLLLSNKKHRVQLSRKRHQPAPLNTRSVSGNGTRLRQHQHQHHQQQLRMMMYHRPSVSSIASSSELALAALQNEDDNNAMVDKKDKQLSKKRTLDGKKRSLNEPKPKKTAAVTPRQSRRRATPPLILEDGRRVFVCKSCGKKYKNRNGLAYHRDRCKYKERGPEEDSSSQQRDELVEEENEEEHEPVESIKCVCEKSTEDRGTMIQCDQCQMWQHLHCVGVDQKDIANDYTCPYCSEKEESKERTDYHSRLVPRSGIDEMEEEEDELAEDDEEMNEEPVTTYTTRDNVIMDQEMEEEDDDEEEDELSQDPLPVILNDDELVGDNDEDEFLSNTDIIRQQNSTNTVAILDIKPVDQELPQPSTSLDDKNKSPSQLAQEWEDLLFSQTTDNLQQSSDIPEPWTKMSGSSHDENTFNNWGFSDLSLLQPPSLLFSDNTMVDEDSSNFPPSSDILPSEDPPSEVAPASPDSLWFQFANFEDDYQCEEIA